MAYTFQSRATSDLIMLKAPAEQILKLLDKPLGEPGIITVEQIPQVLEVLTQAVADDEKRRQALQDGIQDASAEASEQAAAASAELGAVSLHQRIVPLADMLRRSAAEGKPVTWKV
ncbi:MAG: DUF1840 domain-containing protein [Comamonas sp.]